MKERLDLRLISRSRKRWGRRRLMLLRMCWLNLGLLIFVWRGCWEWGKGMFMNWRSVRFTILWIWGKLVNCPKDCWMIIKRNWIFIWIRCSLISTQKNKNSIPNIKFSVNSPNSIPENWRSW